MKFLHSLLLLAPLARAFTPLAATGSPLVSRSAPVLNALTQSTATSTADQIVEIRSFDYQGWNVTYQYKAASRGYEEATPVLLIHPVGIGMSSWFWNRFLEAWGDGPSVVAIDLIGCGLDHGASPLIPEEKGLSVPLGWAQAAEALMQELVDDATDSRRNRLWSTLSSSLSSSTVPQYDVVVQGGLAPVGVVLASRNPERVRNVVLTSPPTWKDLTTAVPQSELARNYEFLTSPAAAPLAFGLLESTWAVRFFSDLFLFDTPCDDDWLREAATETCVAGRPPVQIFNAGLCMHRSYEDELTGLAQSLLIVQGAQDNDRNRLRAPYVDKVPDCTLCTVPGKNVLPWESPQRTVKAIRDFLRV